MHFNNKHNYHLVGDIDGISQWRSLNKAIPSNRTEMVYNINEVSGNAAIRYSLFLNFFFQSWNSHPDNSLPHLLIDLDLHLPNSRCQSGIAGLTIKQTFPKLRYH